MILLFYRHFINKELYIEIIKKLSENEIKSPNKIKKKEEIKNLKLLRYDIILEEKHFYIKAQDKGTCTWHATFIADIFFNYYYPDTKIIDLPKIYNEKRNDFFKLLQNKKFNSFNVDNLNLKIIQNINLSTFKKEIINFYQKDNVKYETDVLKYLYKEYFHQFRNEMLLTQILISNNIKYEDIKNFDDTNNEIISIIEKENEPSWLIDYLKHLDCYNSNSNCSINKLDNLFISS